MYLENIQVVCAVHKNITDADPYGNASKMLCIKCLRAVYTKKRILWLFVRCHTIKCEHYKGTIFKMESVKCFIDTLTYTRHREHTNCDVMLVVSYLKTKQKTEKINNFLDDLSSSMRNKNFQYHMSRSSRVII